MMCSAFQIIMLTWLSFVAMFVTTCFVVHFTHAFQPLPLPTATRRSSSPATAFLAAKQQRFTGTQLWVATMNKASLLTSQSPDDDENDGVKQQQAVATTATRTKEEEKAATTSDELPPPAQQQATTIRPTLSSYLEGAAASGADPEQLAQDMAPILLALEQAFRKIAVIVKRAALDGHTGYAAATDGDSSSSTTNVQGEQQKKLDLITNDILKEALAESGMVASMISEEEEHEIVVEVAGGSSSKASNKYVVAFDPLDGSSNTDTNVPIGSIFAVYRKHPQSGILGNQPLHETLVAAGYCLYSSATSFVFGYGKPTSQSSGQSSGSGGVQGFTFDDELHEFVLTHPNVRVPTRGTTYSFNEANRHTWHPALRSYLEDAQQSSSPKSLRYIGSMVGDIHRTALAGGVFGYPADAKNSQGKLRLLYEVAPMSYLLEMAGGLGLSFSDGNGDVDNHVAGQRVLDIVPRTIHQRCPVVMGSRDDLLELQKRYYYHYLYEESSGNEEDELLDDAEDAEVVNGDDKYYAYSVQGDRIPLTLQEYLKRLEAWF